MSAFNRVAGRPDRSYYVRPGGQLRLQPMWKTFRRLFLALGVAGLVTGVFRLRGSGGVPPVTGGWRELSGPDFN